MANRNTIGDTGINLNEHAIDEPEYVFDEKTKQGWCHVCSVNLASKQTAEDHLRSKGHVKKKKMKEILPMRGIMVSSGTAAVHSLPPDSEIIPPSSRPHEVVGNVQDSISGELNKSTGNGAISNSFDEYSPNIQPDAPNVRHDDNIGLTPEAAVFQCQSGPFSGSATNYDMNSKQQRPFADDNGQEYVFDEKTKKGWCYVCDVNLASKQTAKDHLRSKGHVKKRNLRETQPRLSAMPSSIEGRSVVPNLSQEIMENLPSLQKGNLNVSLEPRTMSSAKTYPAEAVVPSASNLRLDDRSPMSSATAIYGLHEPVSGFDTSCNSDTQQQTDIEGDDVQDYVFNEETKQGWCYVCNVDLSSKQTAEDHLRSKGHEKKKKMRKTLSPEIKEDFPCPLSRDEKAHSSTVDERVKTEASDTTATSSFFIRSCDYPDDLPSAKAHPAQCVSTQQPQLRRDDNIPASNVAAAFNDLNKPFGLSTLETSRNINTPLQSLSTDDNEDEYVFDEKTKKGRCYLCDVEFSSEKQADDHLRGRGHVNKKNLRETSLLSRARTMATPQSPAAAPFTYPVIKKDPISSQIIDPISQGSDYAVLKNSGETMNKQESCKTEMRPRDFNRQDRIDNEQTKKKEIFESGKNVFNNDREQTRRKECFLDAGSHRATPILSREMQDSRNQTHVKTISGGRPTVAVPPHRVTMPTSTNTEEQREGNAPSFESDPNVAAPDADEFFCYVCNVDCTSREMYEQHCSGRQHLSKLRRGPRAQPQGDSSGKVIVSLNLTVEVDK